MSTVLQQYLHAGRREDRMVVVFGQAMGVSMSKPSQKQYFKVAHTIDLGLNDDNSNEVWMLGHFCPDNEMARLIYCSTLWFTYRQAILFRDSALTSDVGWGCMLRVGQMMLAESLRRAEGIEKYSNQTSLLGIIDSFMGEEGHYSIQKLVNAGIRLYKKGAGEWFTPSQTAFILKQLQNNNEQSKLRCIIFHNEFQSTSALEYLSVANKDKTKSITPSFIKKNKGSIVYSQDITIHPGLIIILVRIGYNSPQVEMLQSILTIMKMRAFAGILGGRPGKAHFIIGATAKNFIYLDPHCVKEKSEAEEYFCMNMFSMGHEKVDTSMGLCFFVANYAEFVTLSDQLRELKNNSAFFSYSILDEPKLVELNSPDRFQVLE